jgi:hypothetical protein
MPVAQVDVEHSPQRARRRVSRRRINADGVFTQNKREHIAGETQVDLAFAQNGAHGVQLDNSARHRPDRSGCLAEGQDLRVGGDERGAQSGGYGAGSLEVHLRHQSGQTVELTGGHRGAGLQIERDEQELAGSSSRRPTGRGRDENSRRQALGE